MANTFNYQANSGAIIEVELRKGKVVKGKYQPAVYDPGMKREWNLPIEVIKAKTIKPEDVQPMTDAQFAECLRQLGLSAPEDKSVESDKDAASDSAAQDGTETAQ